MTKIINEKQPNDFVKAYAAATFAVVSALLISSFVTQAFAVDMQTLLVPDRNRTEASFIAVRTVTLEYPAGSSFASVFDGVTKRVSFAVNGTAQEPGAAGQAVAAVNRALAEARSPVQASAVDLAYTATMRGTETRTVISYKVELEPTLEQFVLQRGEGGQSGHIVDLEWRGISIDQPLVVNTPEYGEFDVNRPLTLLQKLYPEIAQALEGTQASTIMDDHLLNFEDFDTSMTVWHKLFDPVGTYGGGVGLQGTEGAKALTVYSFGEGSIREGAHSAEEKDATVSVDGVQIKLHSLDPPPSGQLTIAGYADEQENQGSEFAIVSADAPEGFQPSTGGFPIQVLLVFGGMMGAIAIFILWKARK